MNYSNNPGTWQQYVQRPEHKGVSVTLLERKYRLELHQYQTYLAEVFNPSATTSAAASAGGGGSASATEPPLVITDSDVLAFIAASAITDTTQKSAVNTLVTSLKGYSVWDKLNAIYPFVGGTASTHKWNLKDPRDLDAAYRLEFFGGWTHNSNGITGNGTNTLANTFYVPSTNTMNSLGAYNRTNSTNLTLFGVTAAFADIDNTTNPAGIVLSSNGLIVGFTGRTLSAPYAIGTIVSRTASDGATAIKVYRNGIQSATASNSDWAIANLTQPITIGATRQDDYYFDGETEELVSTNYGGFNTANIAFAFLGNTALTATDALNLNTAMVAYQTTLGRQV